VAKLSIAIVGCGTVGTALGRLLARAGYTIVGVSARHALSAREAAERVGATHYSEVPWQVTKGAKVVFVTTPDDAIATTCQALSDHGGFDDGTVVVHCSGALASSVLASAKKGTVSVASLHPLQSFASVEQAERLVPGSYCTVEGDPQALPIVRRLVADLGGRLLEITAEGKTLYHAAAVVASNYLVTLIHVALTFNRTTGMPSDIAFEALRPLIQGTLDNIGVKGIPDALTGPIARGDIDTVEAHLQAIEQSVPELRDAYNTLGRLTVDLAKDKGTLTSDQAERLISLLR